MIEELDIMYRFYIGVLFSFLQNYTPIGQDTDTAPQKNIKVTVIPHFRNNPMRSAMTHPH